MTKFRQARPYGFQVYSLNNCLGCIAMETTKTTEMEDQKKLIILMGVPHNKFKLSLAVFKVFEKLCFHTRGNQNYNP